MTPKATASMAPSIVANLLHRASRVARHPVDAFRSWHIARTDGRSDQPHIFVTGIARSGTTLIATVLGAHPKIAAMPDESHFFFLQNYRYLSLPGLPTTVLRNGLKMARSRADLFDVIARHYLASSNAGSRFLEKTPWNAEILPELQSSFYNAHFIFIVRDPRDTYASLIRAQTLSNPDVASYADYWLRNVNGYLNADPQRVHLMRYEDFVSDPQAEASKACAFLGLEFEQSILSDEARKESASVYAAQDHHPNLKNSIGKSSIGGWEKTLSDDQAKTLIQRCGAAAAQLGYLDSTPPDV